MKKYIMNFNKYRYLLYELVKKGIVLKYRRSYLGIFWTLLEPLLTMMVLTVVFGGWYGKSDQTFPVYVLTGRLLYSFFSTSTKSAMKAVQNNAKMMKKVYVPKYIYPLSAVIYNYIIFLISLIVLLGVSVVLKVKPTIYLVQAIIPLTLIFIMALGVGLILATLNVFFRDLEYLWGVGLMLIMYSCAIFYYPERLVKTGNDWILKINPVYHVIANFREAVLFGQPLSKEYLIPSLLISFGSLFVGIFVFYKKQDEFILHI
ncbi:MAG: ABC transporter permease [Velocimicrobium sp.]